MGDECALIQWLMTVGLVIVGGCSNISSTSFDVFSLGKMIEYEDGLILQCIAVKLRVLMQLARSLLIGE